MYIENLASIDPNKVIATLPVDFRPSGDFIPVRAYIDSQNINSMPFAIAPWGDIKIVANSGLAGPNSQAAIGGSATFNVTV